jgi:predicted RNA-binding protein with TRAM domain
MVKVIIDRFEGDYAVAEMEDKTMVNIPKCLIPESQEGDIVRIEIDKDETEQRNKDIKKLMNDLWE